MPLRVRLNRMTMTGDYYLVVAVLLVIAALFLGILIKKKENSRIYTYLALFIASLSVTLRFGRQLKGGNGAVKYTYYINGIKAGSGFFAFFKGIGLFFLAMLIGILIAEGLGSLIGKPIWKKEKAQKGLIAVFAVLAVIPACLASAVFLRIGIPAVRIKIDMPKARVAGVYWLALLLGIIIVAGIVIGIVNLIKALKRQS